MHAGTHIDTETHWGVALKVMAEQLDSITGDGITVMCRIDCHLVAVLDVIVNPLTF